MFRHEQGSCINQLIRQSHDTRTAREVFISQISVQTFGTPLLNGCSFEHTVFVVLLQATFLNSPVKSFPRLREQPGACNDKLSPVPFLFVFGAADDLPRKDSHSVFQNVVPK